MLHLGYKLLLRVNRGQGEMGPASLFPPFTCVQGLAGRTVASADPLVQTPDPCLASQFEAAHA